MNICPMKGTMSEEHNHQLTDQIPADQTPENMLPKNANIAEDFEITDEMIERFSRMSHLTFLFAFNHFLGFLCENLELTKENNEFLKEGFKILQEAMNEQPKPNHELIKLFVSFLKVFEIKPPKGKEFLSLILNFFKIEPPKAEKQKEI